MSKINIQEAKNILKYIIENNKKLEAEGKKTTAIELVGAAGLGKTSAILQVAEELNMGIQKINLAQIEELGDLIGFPIKEYYVCAPSGECAWVASDTLSQYMEMGYKLHNNMHRMSYALPSWVPKEEYENGFILLLDDFNRADPRMIQATMELIDRGTYVSWSLPKKCTIVLSSNPSDGTYSTVEEDTAQKSRRISFDISFDIETWAKWAEEANIDERLINFALLYPEIFEEKEGNQIANARSYVTFANTISGISNFNTPENLAMIFNIASGCFSDKENFIGNAFTSFVNNKLDKLIPANDLLFKDWKSIKDKLTELLYENDNYRADIANIITIRLINAIELYFKKNGAKSEVIINRIIDFVDNDVVLLSEDLIFHLCKTLVGQYPNKTLKLVTNPKIKSKLL